MTSLLVSSPSRAPTSPGATNNLEWYDPRMVTTANGSLVITLEPADPATNHDLGYMGGMLSTWNKCARSLPALASRARAVEVRRANG